jgi:acetylornithine deacetylase/succinyl-diaminopimelate desuccinylase family protein
MPVSEDIKRRVLANVNQDDVIELSRKLVRIPSETGNEKAVSDLCVGMLREDGLDVRAVAAPTAPERPNVVGMWHGVGGGPTVMFSGHLDTVGVGDRFKWITDPYGGEVIDGRLYGRGAMDSKGGGIASVLVALRAIQKAGLRLKGNVLVVGTVDEEAGGRLGMRFLIESGAIQPDMVVYCVHSNMEIKAYFKGVCWLEWTVHGQTAHGSMPHRGVNAVTRAAYLITVLEQRGILPFERHPILGDMSYNFGWITGGGEKPRYNMVPDLCQFGLDVRLVPGQSSTQLEQAMQALTAELKTEDPALDASFKFVTRREPCSVSQDQPVLRIVKGAAAQIMGHEPTVSGTISTGDLTSILEKGIPGIGFGPGDLDRGNAHKENEFIEVSQLVDATKVYALTMLEACGIA